MSTSEKIVYLADVNRRKSEQAKSSGEAARKRYNEIQRAKLSATGRVDYF